MANTLWDLSASLAAGATHRSLNIDSFTASSGLQIDLKMGPRLRWGGHSIKAQAFYQNTYLSEGLLIKKEGQMAHSFGGSLGYNYALNRWVSLFGHSGLGGVQYTGGKSPQFGEGFSIELATPLGLHWEVGGGLNFWADRLGLSASYFQDVSALKINAAAGPVIGSGGYSYDVTGVNILLQVDLATVLKNP